MILATGIPRASRVITTVSLGALLGFPLYVVAEQKRILDTSDQLPETTTATARGCLVKWLFLKVMQEQRVGAEEYINRQIIQIQIQMQIHLQIQMQI